MITLLLVSGTATRANQGVEVKRDGTNVDFFVGGKLFTRYDTTTGPNKPYFYPVYAPNGKLIVRRLPGQTVEGETTDHPHHRGIWFTHGAMNGVDFWLEKPGTREAGGGGARTVHTGYEKIESGPVYGRMVATTDWITPDGKKIAEDRRAVRVYSVKNGYLMDFEIRVTAVGGPLVWGDTKEGTFGIRMADSIRVNPGKGQKGEGRIVNSVGDKDAAAWGKRAAWVDYYGPVEGQIVGVAIFDHPENLRHPTTWHVRDYGLFAANPFGLHDFDPALKDNPKAGEHTTPEGQTTSFRYRLYFHEGNTEQANVPALWAAYARTRILPPSDVVITGSTRKVQSLFAGKTLAGWERKAVHGGNGGIWTVEKGAIVGDQEPDHKGGLLGTKQTYGDFEIELEFLADGFPLDSGLFLRTQPDGNGYQVTIDNTKGGFIGSIYVSRDGFVARDSNWQPKFKKGQWNHLRARIVGQPPRLQVWLNGQQTVDFQDKEERLPRTGYIGLQVHGGAGSWDKDSRIRFRNLRIRPLK